MELKSLIFVLFGLLAVQGRSVDILRMNDRGYGSEEEMIDTEMVDVDSGEDADCQSCCDPPEVVTCGEFKNKIDAIDYVIAGIGCPEGGQMGEYYMTNDEDCMVVAEEAIPECMERMAGTEDEGDGTKMEICLQEVIRDLVEYGEVESGSTVQGCMCQGFLANRRTLEDASKLFCSNNGNRRNRRSLNYNGFMSHSGLQGAFSSKHSYQPTTPHSYQPTTPHSYRPTTQHYYQPTTPHYYQPTTPHYYQPTTPHYYQPPHSGVNPKYKSTLKPRMTGGAYKVGSFVMGINN